MWRRWLMVGTVTLLVAGGSALTGARWAGSQPGFREGAFVATSDGSRWVVGNGARYRITFALDDSNMTAGLRDGPSVATVAEAVAALGGSPAAPPAAAPRPPANPAESLVGQVARVCSYGVPIDIQVVSVEWRKELLGTTAPGNAMWIVALLDVTNQGTTTETLYGGGSAKVTDERGRDFDWRQYPPDPVDFTRAYNVKLSGFNPGITEQTVAAFQVPGDVQRLTLVGKSLGPVCP